MSFFQEGTKQATYHYDALGRRVAKAIQDGATSFTNSYSHLGLEDRILQAKNGMGEVTTYLDGSWVDDHLGEVRPSGAKSYLKDHLGSILNSTPAGAARSFGIWGEPAALANISPSAEPVSYGYTGREHDRESGLNYHRARSLNTSTGRWLSQDDRSPVFRTAGEVSALGDYTPFPRCNSRE